MFIISSDLMKIAEESAIHLSFPDFVTKKCAKRQRHKKLIKDSETLAPPSLSPTPARSNARPVKANRKLLDP